MTVPPFEPYTYTSDNCAGYTITYEAQQVTENGAMIPLPAEVQFFPNTRTFVAKKCVDGDADSMIDIECTDESILPYTKQFRIVVIATLQTDLQTFVNYDNEFDLVITPNCRSDTLSLMSDWVEFQYYITKENTDRLVLIPFIDQQVQTCFKECSLVQWGWDSYLNPPVVFFDSATGELHVETDDYYFDGLELQLKLQCETPYSIQNESETSDIDYFEVKFTSECRDTVLTPAVPQFIQATTSLWSMLHIPF